MMNTDFATVVKSDDEVHVVPVDDICDHEIDDRCICGPTEILVWNEGRHEGSVIAHPSLDGREIGD